MIPGRMHARVKNAGKHDSMVIIPRSLISLEKVNAASGLPRWHIDGCLPGCTQIATDRLGGQPDEFE